MKKKLLCAAALAAGFMFTTVEANAQSISVGPRLGLNMNKLIVDGTEDDDAVNDETEFGTGISGGVALNIGINDMFSIQPELLYTQRGSKSKLGEAEIETKLGYVEIPILARASFGEEMKFFVNAGPNIGFLLSNKTEVDGEELEEDGDGDSLDGMNRVDFGLMGGIGIGIQAGPGMFTIEGRYNYGLSSIIEEAEDADSDYKQVNRNIGFSVSYMIPIGG